MNKGRNIMILMCCLLLLGCLTFLTRTKSQNYSEVVDDVRYILKSSTDSVKNYEFYFKDEIVMTGVMETTEEGTIINIYIRESYDETLQDYLTEPYAYYYTVSGTEKDNAVVEWGYIEDIEDSQKLNKPYERFTPEVFKSMIYGTEPYIAIWQALTVAVLALAGGAVILKAEELWHILYKKSEDEYPAWEDMNGIKRVGIGILIFNALLLILFIFL